MASVDVFFFCENLQSSNRHFLVNRIWLGFFDYYFYTYLSHLLYKLSGECAVGYRSAIEGQTAYMNSRTGLCRDAVRFCKVSQEPRQTCHKLFFYKYLSHLLYRFF